MNKFMDKVKDWLSAFGPGVFLIGYTIGTGSVTLMASAGSRYGLSLLWGLALSCFFVYFMLTAHGRYTLVTGETILHSYRKYIPFGNWIAILTLIGLVLIELMALMGITGIVADVIVEWSRIHVSETGWNPLIIAAFLIVLLFSLIMVGNYSLFERILILFVGIMGLSFLTSMFLVIRSPSALIGTITPALPNDKTGIFLLVGLIGTTLTAPSFVVRCILVKEKKWTIKDLRTERNDCVIASILMFVISGSIMICAAGTLYTTGQPVEKAIDMVHTLEPFAGRFAVSIFILGIVGAGLSSLFPISLLGPWLYCDYMGREFKRSPGTTGFIALSLLCGLIVPLTGARPVYAMIVSQFFQIFLLPVVVLCVMYLTNRKDLMGDHRAGLWLNLGAAGTLIFSLAASFEGILGVMQG